MTHFLPRASQRQVIAYTGGRMGIAAVPGSGKTHALAELAAKLVTDSIGEGQEVLVVTLVNSAVDNIKGRIDEAIKRRRLLPGFGYRVRTLHGLSHDIVRERPALVGLADDFGIIDELGAESLRQETVSAWLNAHPDSADAYLRPDLDPGRAAWFRKSRWPQLVRNLVSAFIKRAKDLQMTPGELQALLAPLSSSPPGNWGAPMLGLVQMAAEVYTAYQHSLSYRGMVDFDDLVRLASVALQRDSDYLARLQQRWPFVLEDEAQDSSMLQEDILQLLSSRSGNWVRVGDPNQAIYETFTTADPKLLLGFLEDLGNVQRLELSVSGRSQPGIIGLANELVDWVRTEHPTPAARAALVGSHILPTSPGDPQPNPPADLAAVHLVTETMTPDHELKFVVHSVAEWFAAQQLRDAEDRETCAVLAPRNQRGSDVGDLLKQRAVPYVELLRSTTATRETAGALGYLLRCLADPASPTKLSHAFRVWRRADRDQGQAEARMRALAHHVAQCRNVEAYLWPRTDHDWLGALASRLPAEELTLLNEFRDVARRWHRAATLPVDQLVLTLAGDLFQEPADLALVHKLGLLLQDVASAHPDYRLPQLVQELEVIARNERRFLGFSSDDTAFTPPKGVVTVTTMHKGKGLEWDRVYLLSVNNFDFPSGQVHDIYQDEPDDVRGRLNLPAETLRILSLLASAEPGESIHFAPEGEATRDARIRYICERLRLLYVGITRAKRSLTITWNRGNRLDSSLQAAAPLLALQSCWARIAARGYGDG